MNNVSKDEEAVQISAILDELDKIETPNTEEMFNPDTELLDDDNDNDDKQMSDDEVISEVNNYIANGIGGVDNNDNEITLPLNYYFGKLPGLSKTQIKDKNASRFVSKDVSEAIDSTIAEISELFSVDQLVIFKPKSMQDEVQAQQESEMINDLFFNHLGGYTLLQRALKDCLLHRNASAKVYWNEKISVSYEEHNNINPIILPLILQPTSENQKVDIIEQDIESVEEYNGDEPVFVEESVSIKIRRTTVSGEPKIDIIKPESLIVNADHEAPSLRESKFVAYEHILYQSELRAAGFPEEIVEQLKEYTGTFADISRSQSNNDYNYYSSNNDKLVKIYECYTEMDVDGDGIAELRKIIISDDTLLYNEPTTSKSIVSGTAAISPHNFTGISLFDQIAPIQDAKTHILRSVIDGTRLSSNPRVGVVNGAANIDDLLTSRTGGVVRMTNPTGIVDLPRAEVPQSSYTFLEMMNSIRRERGGSAIDTAKQAQQIAGQTAHGIERTMSAMEQGNLLLARTFAETFIRDLFLELHNVIRENYQGKIEAKINGRWNVQEPNKWPERTNLIVSLGGSKAEKASKIIALSSIIASQEKLYTAKSVLFNEKKLYKALSDLAKFSGITSPDLYYVDPESEEGQQAKQMQQQQAMIQQATESKAKQAMNEAQQMIGQAEIMKGQSALQSAQSKFEIEKMKSEMQALQSIIDQNQNDKELLFKYEKLASDQAMKLTELEAKYEKELSDEAQENYQEQIINEQLINEQFVNDQIDNQNKG